jgi:endonuclease/exonuclease/phosphatase family metal-dependent hydrolase
MVKAFSVASWNVKHFKYKKKSKVDKKRIDRVVKFLNDQDPDVFALYEVTGKEIFKIITKYFPDYYLQITEGKQTQEILIGVRNTISSFITQRTEFKSGTTHMRPGQLVTIIKDKINYSLLFLHLASSTKPRGMGLRDDMLYRAVKFRKALDKGAGGKNKSNYIFLGDLNIMGMYYPYKSDIKLDIELKKWVTRAKQYYGMRKLNKTFNKTWFGGSSSSIEPADLDHVFAAKHLKFTDFKNKNDKDVEVDVRGWVEEKNSTDKDTWIRDYSDHALLYFEVMKPE